MAPEAVMLLIDSSEYMRNGDFTPTRFEAQSDAVSVIFSAKIGANPENTVGVMTMGGAGGKGPEVLVTPTPDLGKVLSAMHKAHIGGESDINTGIQVAQLALKHRQNKTQRQRIIILLGSPLSPTTDEKALIKLGKKLKKNNVAVDVVYFAGGNADESAPEEGAPEGGDEGVLGRFVESVASGDNSHIISIPPGPHLLSDVIASSSVLAGEGGAYSGGMGGDGGGEGSGGGGGGGGGGGNFEFGVDPDMDPELAAVLRMSMEEETARQAAAASSSAPSSAPLASVPESSDGVPNPLLAPSAPLPNSSIAPPLVPTIASAGAPESDQTDEDAELAAALALSAGEGAAHSGGDVEMADEEEEEDDEEEAMRRAIEMSMAEQEEQDKKDAAK